MEHPIIEIKNISKEYMISHDQGRYVTLRDVLTTIMRRPFSFLRAKAKQVAGIDQKERFLALHNISLSVQRGEVIGIIGHNGAGKSTLLKILSQITPPTAGEIVIRGKVGSLLEVGTGFHPELTGRENIFLNGAILGMKKDEIASKFDQIVEFAGISKFLDTPVKYYSSGMYVRLAFSVAAHMEPDILIVDEVLAVGDAEFQKKCLGKMDEITKKDGRTILFVSHNLNAIKQLCTKTAVLKKGEVAFFGNTEQALKTYDAAGAEINAINVKKITQRRGDGRVKLTGFRIEDMNNGKMQVVKSGENMQLVFMYECERPEEIRKLDVGFSIHRNGQLITELYSSRMGTYFSNLKKEGEVRFTLESIPLSGGIYTVHSRFVADGIETDWPRSPIGSFEVRSSEFYGPYSANENTGNIIVFHGKWKNPGNN